MLTQLACILFLFFFLYALQLQLARHLTLIIINQNSEDLLLWAVVVYLSHCVQDVHVYGCPSFWFGLVLIPSIVLLSDIAIKT